jgi:hypothetical protein
MYANPILLPQYSNREDLLLPLSIFDDDLGTPVNLSGTTGSGTFSSWVVTDGVIVTTSATTITIPGYPNSGQLSALSLTVGTGLGILQGDPITIADAMTGLNTMQGYVLSYSANTGALVVQIGMTFQFEIRRLPHTGHSSFSNGYSVNQQFGVYDESVPEIVASLGNGIMITDVGFIQILIPEVQMKTLRAHLKLACLTMTDSVNTRQLFIAQLPLLFGGVTN